MVLHRKGHFILLLGGTLLFLIWLLAGLLLGESGSWDPQRSELFFPPQGGSDLGKAVVQAKLEATYAKQAIMKVGIYLAFAVTVLGHALLWPEVSSPYKPTVTELLPTDGQ